MLLDGKQYIGKERTATRLVQWAKCGRETLLEKKGFCVKTPIISFWYWWL